MGWKCSSIGRVQRKPSVVVSVIPFEWCRQENPDFKAIHSLHSELKASLGYKRPCPNTKQVLTKAILVQQWRTHRLGMDFNIANK